MLEFRVIVTCDRSYDTFELKKFIKQYFEDLIFFKLHKFKQIFYIF